MWVFVARTFLQAFVATGQDAAQPQTERLVYTPQLLLQVLVYSTIQQVPTTLFLPHCSVSPGYMPLGEMLRSNSLFSRESSRVSSTLPLLSAKRCSSKSFLAANSPLSSTSLAVSEKGGMHGIFIENIIIHQQILGFSKQNQTESQTISRYRKSSNSPRFREESKGIYCSIQRMAFPGHRPQRPIVLLARVSPTIRVEFSWIRVSCSLAGATGVAS